MRRRAANKKASMSKPPQLLFQNILQWLYPFPTRAARPSRTIHYIVRRSYCERHQIVVHQEPSIIQQSRTRTTVRRASPSLLKQGNLKQYPQSTISDGSDLLENVCVFPKGVVGIGERITYTPTLRSYSETQTDFVLCDAVDLAWAGWTKKTKGYPVDQWYHDSSQSLHVPEETILLMDVWNNPGHCLNDETFSLAHDIFNATSGQHRIPFYSRVFLVSTFHMIENWCNRMAYCCEFLQMLGLIDPKSIVKVKKATQLICFARLFLILVLFALQRQAPLFEQLMHCSSECSD
jgi:hypothetical protein